MGFEATGGRSALDQVAALVTSPSICVDEDEMLVLALRPEHDNRRVIASAGNSAVRAAISVSIAAGNLRAWAAVRDDDVVDVPVASLPEIIRAAIQPSGLQSIRVAAVRDGESPACLLMWLSRTASPSSTAQERHVSTLRALIEAVARDHDSALQRAADETFVTQTAEAAIREVPELDPLATIPTREQFDAALAGLKSDETGLIAIALDDMDSLQGELGAEAAEQIRRAVAGRLSSACRRNDVVARVAEDAFAVLLVDVDRRSAFEISKRLRSEVCEPIELAARTVELSISVGLSHEVGLVDPVDLFVSAESAMEDAREAGGARMLVAC